MVEEEEQVCTDGSRVRRVNVEEEHTVKKMLVNLVLLIVCIVAFLFVIGGSGFVLATVPTGSMEPTVMAGSGVLGTKLKESDPIERGGVYVFYNEELGINLIKRVVGLPGETITIKNGIVYIDEIPYIEDYVVNKSFETLDLGTVPDDCYLFLGDNRADSFDARFWEVRYIDRSLITSKASKVIRPINEAHTIE